MTEPNQTEESVKQTEKSVKRTTEKIVNGEITLAEWVDFVMRHTGKRHHDPRRARPI